MMKVLNYFGWGRVPEPAATASGQNQTPSTTEVTAWLTQGVSYSVKVLGDTYHAWKERINGVGEQDPAVKEAEAQLLAAMRSIVDISAMCFQPYAAFAGVLVSTAKPELSTQVCGIVSNTIHESWVKLSFEGKIVVGLVTVGASYMWLPVLSTVATIYALKVGAEMTNRNLQSERRNLEIKTS